MGFGWDCVLNVEFVEVINSIVIWNELSTGYLQGSSLIVSEENSGDSCAPFLGLHIYYVLYNYS